MSFVFRFRLKKDSGGGKSLFTLVHIKENGGKYMEFNEGEESEVGIRIALFNQFFASSTSSRKETSKP